MCSILHIEDNFADVILLQEALSKYTTSPIKYIAMTNGKEGLAFLQNTNDYPDLILLDINMPVLDGKDFLRERNKNEALRKIPTVVLTTSKSNKDITECYDLNANAYLMKTLDFEEFCASISATLKFWLKFNRVCY